MFVTPSHQFPTGVVLSMARRLELLAWAREKRAWIVEDDYASEFRYGGRPLASLQGLDDGERVIYIGTLNKALFPGLRLGYAVVPRPLLRAFVTDALSDGPAAIDPEPGRRCRLHGGRSFRGAYPPHARTVPGPARRAGRGAERRLGVELTVDAPDQGMHLVAFTRKGLSDIAIERTGAPARRDRSRHEPALCCGNAAIGARAWISAATRARPSFPRSNVWLGR